MENTSDGLPALPFLMQTCPSERMSRLEPGQCQRQLSFHNLTLMLPLLRFARDNVYNFIKFCRLLQVMEVVMFETEDLVSQKNEKHVVLTLLEVARRGAKIGMLAPMVRVLNQFYGG